MAFKDEKKDIEMPYDITSDELALMDKRIKRAMKFNKKILQEPRIWKRKKTL